MRFRYLSAIFVELVILVAAAARPALGNLFSGDLELLKTTALLQKANSESLLTWKGEATEEITATGGGLPDLLVRNDVTFAYDRIRNAVRWNKEPQERHRAIDGTVQEVPLEEWYESSMMIDDKTYHCSWMGRTDDAGLRYDLVVGGPVHARNWDAYHLDPRLFWANPVSEEPFHERLMRLYDTGRLPEHRGRNEQGRRLEGHVKQEGDLVVLEKQLTLDREGNKVTTRDVYDLSRGGNLIEYYNNSPGVENLHTYEYEEKAGVWVPKSYTHMNRSSRKSGPDRQKTRTVKWGQSTVNVPFDEDEFTLAKMGVKPGAHIHDHLVGMRYTYMGGLGDSELLNPAYLAVDEANEANTVGKTLLARAREETGAVADANRDAAERTNAIGDSRGTHGYLFLFVIVIVVGVGGGRLQAHSRRQSEKQVTAPQYSHEEECQNHHRCHCPSYCACLYST